MKQGLPRFLLLLMPLLALTTVEADASAVCDRLRERLTRTTEVIGSNAEARELGSAIAQRNFQIRRARNDLRQFGCSEGSVVVIGGEQAAVCGEIEIALARLEADKRDLARKRDAARANGALGPEGRRRILASLEYNGCNTPEEDTRVTNTELDPAERMRADREAAELRNETIISGIAEEPLDEMDRSRPLVGEVTRGGSLRTVCVRACDGGFFPISSNATSLDFARDANTCSQMCPGIGTELFYHSIYSAEAADMISASSGRPYRELENAFGYRDRKTGEKSSCSCNLPAYYQQMQRRGETAKSASDDNYSSVTEIKTKTPPSSGAKGSIAVSAPERPERAYDPADQKIRKVGPEFLNKDGGKLDLTKPALEGAQPLQ